MSVQEENSPPSIFNDVLGPVMRGPSSSHSAAANRIGRLCRDLMGGDLSHVTIDYDPSGSLVTTHNSQGTDMGLYGGFLGWTADDDRLPDYKEHVQRSGLGLEVRYLDYGATHPNTYRLHCRSAAGETLEVEAISTGGGAIELTRIDGCSTSIQGDRHAIVLFFGSDTERDEFCAEDDGIADSGNVFGISGERHVAVLSLTKMPSETFVQTLAENPRISRIRTLIPVLPVKSTGNENVPFQTVDEMISYRNRAGEKLTLWELAVAYESARSGLTETEIFEKAKVILEIMEAAVQEGLAGTEYEDRILPCQSVNFARRHAEGRLIPGDANNLMIANITAILEVKSSMGLIVAAPTAGSCGTMPGSVLAVAETLQASQEAKVRALLSAGLIGVFIATHATFAAEVGGCMAECGSASGMAAAAMVELGKGTLDQQLSAASLALQNSFGMTCDPVANRVEAPCLGKNVMAGANALSCANMALADYVHLIPLDEVIKAMDEVGKAMPHELRCTGKGGLATTPTSLELAGKFKSC